MNFRCVSWLLIAACFAVGTFQNLKAGSAQIGHTPILTATLPLNSTYQVEFSSNGTMWASAGVLVAGNVGSSTVRLDGFPANHSYRLVSVGGANIITPGITKGLHLGASAFAGAGEVRFESIDQFGGSWTHQAFAFPNAKTPFITPLRSLSAPQRFYRAVQPAQPLVPATVSFYQVDTNNTASGYGMVADDMPQLYREGRIAALCPAAYHRGGSNAAAAGESYELVGPQGTTTVIVADLMGDWPARTCDVGQPYFDIGERAFTNLFTPGIGFGTATFRLVPTPVIGNIKMVCIVEAGGYYFDLRLYNHRAGISKLEVQGSGGEWIELPRTSYNSFVYNTGTPLAFPFNTRVTSRFGEQVTFPAIHSMTSGARFTANGQFNVFPDQGPSPIWLVSPVYGDALTNVLGGDWGAAPYGGTTVNTTYSGSVYQGTHSLRISSMGAFGGVSLTAPVKFPPQIDSYVEFAIRSEGAAINGLTMQIEGTDNFGAQAQSAAITLPAIDGVWRVFRIPLAPASAPAQITQLRLMNSTSASLPSIDLDSVAFR